MDDPMCVKKSLKNVDNEQIDKYDNLHFRRSVKCQKIHLLNTTYIYGTYHYEIFSVITIMTIAFSFINADSA